MAKIVFRSKFAGYRVYFDPRHYGAIETEVPLTDANGNAVTDTHGQVIRRRVPVPAAKFTDGVLALEEGDPIQSRQIAALRKYIEVRTAQGHLSQDECVEEDPNMVNQSAFASGAILVTVPEPMTDEAADLIWGSEKGPGLLTYFSNPISPNALNGAFDLLDRAIAHFEVQGIISPTKERAKKQLRSRIIDLVYALNDAGLNLLDESDQPMKRAGAAEGAAA